MDAAGSLERRRFRVALDGAASRRLIPYMLVFGAFAIFGPFADVAILVASATGQLSQVVQAWIALTVLSTILTAVAFALDGQSVWKAWITPFHYLLYRPFLYMSTIRAAQIASMGGRPRWNRRDDRTEPGGAPPPAFGAAATQTARRPAPRHASRTRSAPARATPS